MLSSSTRANGRGVKLVLCGAAGPGDSALLWPNPRAAALAVKALDISAPEPDPRRPEHRPVQADVSKQENTCCPAQTLLVQILVQLRPRVYTAAFYCILCMNFVLLNHMTKQSGGDGGQALAVASEDIMVTGRTRLIILCHQENAQHTAGLQRHCQYHGACNLRCRSAGAHFEGQVRGGPRRSREVRPQSAEGIERHATASMLV